MHTPEMRLTEQAEAIEVQEGSRQSRTMNNDTEEQLGFLIAGPLRQAVRLSVFVPPTPAPGLARRGERNPEKSKLDKR